jgi:hypothetical protein
MQRTLTALLLSAGAVLACQSEPPPPEPWMPTGADAEVVSPEEAAAEAEATIHDDNADAVYDELMAEQSSE